MATDFNDTAPIIAAADRLRAFADSWEAGVEIDKESGLTVDDLRILLERIAGTLDIVAIRTLDLNNLPPDIHDRMKPPAG